MADNKNVELNDEMMAKASGGTVDVEPYGFICEATVVSGPGTATVNGVPRTEYSVSADNGKKYIAGWQYTDVVLKAGNRVQLIHDQDGGFSLEPIPNEG